MDFVDKERDIFFGARGKYIFIRGNTGVTLFETELLSDEIINPLTNIKMSNDEILYIIFALNCYLTTKDINLNIFDEYVEWYINLRKSGKSFKDIRSNQEYRDKFNIIRYYLTPTDFQEHFKLFNPNDSNAETYERDLAQKALIKSGETGKWLIRHSSKNRPKNEQKYNYLIRFGIRYYVISWLESDSIIKHILIRKVVGIGWQYFQNDFYHTFTNFLECLEYVLLTLNLEFNKRISVYVDTDF